MGELTCLTCFRTFLRIIIVGVNICITVLGLLVMSVGAWSQATGKTYVDVTDNSQVYAQLPVLLIVVGLFIMLLGIMGVVGGIFANYIVGRIILGIYGFILALFVFIEIVGGIAAAVEKDKVGSYIGTGINNTFLNFNETKETWNFIQEKLKCCGTYNYTSYRDLLQITPPTSCCKHKDNCNPLDSSNLFENGCTQLIKDDTKYILGVVAGIAITFGLAQIVGVVVSCFVAIAGHKVAESNKYQVV